MGDLSSEMYSDKLIAQDYIYKFGKILQERKFILASQNVKDIDKVFKRDRADIVSLLANYEKTKLTKHEKIQFQEFKKNVLLMMLLEHRYLLPSSAVSKINLLKMQDRSLNISLTQLDKLADIQTSSAKQLNEASKQIVTFSTLLNHFDWAVIIIIGLIIQVIIFTTRSTIPKRAQDQFLN